MNAGKIVFSQIMEHLPWSQFQACVKRYRGNYKVQRFTCLDQFYCMAFAQLTYRESLRDIEACLRANQSKLYHMGIRSIVARNTLAKANERRDWRIYADFAYILIDIARKLYAGDSFGVELTDVVYAFDSTTIDLCLSLFPWAKFRSTKSGIKMHTLLDMRGRIPSCIWITEAKVHDVNILDDLIIEPGAIYVMDRGYVDFARLYNMHQSGAFFVTRAKTNLAFRRRYSHPIDRSTGVRCDQTIVLTGPRTAHLYPIPLRRIAYFDAETDKRLTFLTNNFLLLALIIADLYKARWNVETFFKWIKQNLRIKAFYGTSENAVKTQIWTAISTYVLVSILKKRLNSDFSLYKILQILSVSIFEKTPILELFSDIDYKNKIDQSYNQLYLFDL